MDMRLHDGKSAPDPDGSADPLSAAFARHGWRFSVSRPPGRADLSFAARWSDQDSLNLACATDDPDQLLLTFLDLVGARISRRARTVRAFPLVPELSAHTLEHFAMDVVLPRVIAETCPLVVHGALVARGARGVCLIGASGRGKSTLSAAMRKAGWGFHGDDALEIRTDGPGIVARATYPSLRLFPDSLKQLFAEPPAGLSPVADYLDKLRLDPREAAEPTCPPHLRAVFVLAGDDGTGEVAARPLAASKLCMTLVTQSFALDPPDSAAARVRLTAAGAVTASVPGFELSYPRDYARLPEVIGQIGACLARVAPEPAPGP